MTTRADDTRARIRRAARSRFAAEGYRAATIRAIAADADIDPSMVMRYFGDKAGLFAEVVDIDLRLPDLSAVPRRRLGATVVDHFLTRWEGDAADDALLVLLRSAATDEAASARLVTLFAEQLVPALRPVVPDTEAEKRAGLVSSQMLGLALTRHVLRLPPVVALDRIELVRLVGPTVQRYLTSRWTAG